MNYREGQLSLCNNVFMLFCLIFTPDIQNRSLKIFGFKWLLLWQS